MGHPQVCPPPAGERVVGSLTVQSSRQFTSNKKSSKCMTQGPAALGSVQRRRPRDHQATAGQQFQQHIWKHINMKFHKKLYIVLHTIENHQYVCVYMYIKKHPIHSKMHLPEVNKWPPWAPPHPGTQTTHCISGHRSGRVAWLWPNNYTQEAR